MTEIKVAQQSPEWFELRKKLPLTASKFGEALGVGKGKPYDFLVSLVAEDEIYDNIPTKETSHGIELEPVINEAYQILTGLDTRLSGFWIPDGANTLHNISGASPDALVYDRDSNWIGLAEYKAPVYQLYTTTRHPPHGIPRQYMAQIQTQMAVCKMPWCDFMAVCTASKDMMLQRVHFHPSYWQAIATEIKQFCSIVQEARIRESKFLDPLDFEKAHRLKKRPIRHQMYPGESYIKVDNLLSKDSVGRFCTKRGSFYYDLLMAT